MSKVEQARSWSEIDRVCWCFSKANEIANALSKLVDLFLKQETKFSLDEQRCLLCLPSNEKVNVSKTLRITVIKLGKNCQKIIKVRSMNVNRSYSSLLLQSFDRRHFSEFITVIRQTFVYHINCSPGQDDFSLFFLWSLKKKNVKSLPT